MPCILHFLNTHEPTLLQQKMQSPMQRRRFSTLKSDQSENSSALITEQPRESNTIETPLHCKNMEGNNKNVYRHHRHLAYYHILYILAYTKPVAQRFDKYKHAGETKIKYTLNYIHLFI